jgi:hypothetical protein
MKLNLKPAKKINNVLARCATRIARRVKPSKMPAPAAVPERFRRLKWNELVSRGDFVADGRQGFEPWEGPPGFRADAFLKPIYRRWKHQPAGAGKPE